MSSVECIDMSKVCLHGFSSSLASWNSVRNYCIKIEKNQNYVDHHAFYAVYNVTNVFYSAIKGTNFHNSISYNAGECPFAIIARKFQFVIPNVEKATTRYQMIKNQCYGRKKEGKIGELGEMPPRPPPGFVAV